MVFSAAPSSPATCLFNKPVTTNEKTSRSRGVSVSYRRWISAFSACFANRIPRATDGAANRVQEFVTRERFLEEIHRPGFHGPHARGHVPVTGDEDDGDRVALPIERLLELEAVQPRQADIQDET